HLQSLGKKYFCTMDIVWFLSKPDVKEQLKLEKTLSERTARKWLKRMEFRYGTGKNGMYIDGHEREDVVHYHKRIVLLTHDESTFYVNDRCKLHWIHKDEKPEPVGKGEGVSIMVSDF
ncbi:hypothetical protein M422DRAFT_120266, partial [Sphaerobolus stellatus SS14]